MKEDMYRNENKEAIKMTTEQIWKSMSILRGVLPIEHHHVYLFLLSAYYDRVIDSIHIDYPEELYKHVFYSLEEDPQYSRIVNVYNPIIRSIPEVKLNEILQNFTMLNLKVLDTYFDKIFDDLLFMLADSQGKYSGDFLLPYEISEFVMDIADVPRNGSVFNPFAGLASFAANLNNEEKYYGQEISNTTWALGMLRLLRQKSNVSIDYKLEDSVSNWPINKNFDLVISNPPFRFKVDSWEVNNSYSSRRINAEQYVLQKGLESINYDGKVICVTSLGTLFRGGSEKRFRKYLINEGLVDTIISLPGGLLKHTGIPICIWILTRKKNNNGLVRLVDGRTFVTENNRRDKRLDNHRLFNYLKSDYHHEFVRMVDIDTIEENKFDLNVQRYFIDDVEGVALKEILNQVKGIRKYESKSGIIVRTSNLKDNDISYTLNIKELEARSLSPRLIKIEKSCLLVSTRWKNLKPTLFSYTGTPIYIGVDILALEINTTNHDVDMHYLVSELRSSIVMHQFSAYQNTAAIQYLSRSDFFSIKISLPAIEEQRAKVRGILELSKKFKSLQNERNALAHGQHVKSFDEFASLKHSLGAPRQNILSNAKSLIRFFESNNSNSFQEVKSRYAERYETDLIKDLIQIQKDITHISAILDKGVKGLILENYELKPIAIKNIQEILVEQRRSRDKFEVEFEKVLNEEIKDKAILANSTLFQIMLDNIVTNVEKYGFKAWDKFNLMVIELKVTEDFMILELRNNGEPFPKNYDKEKFTAKFSTIDPENGTGLGGYDIDRIANYFGNPDWELDLNENSPFPVSFKFNFSVIPYEI